MLLRRLRNGLLGLILLLGFQALGALVAHIPALENTLSIPAPVVGLLLLFVFLTLYKKVPAGIAESGGLLLKWMSVLFVPAGVGVLNYLPLLQRDGLAIITAMLVSTALAMATTWWIWRLLTPKALPQ